MFRTFLSNNYRFKTIIKNIDSPEHLTKRLSEEIKKIILTNLAIRVAESNKLFKKDQNSTNFLDWKKLKYHDRANKSMDFLNSTLAKQKWLTNICIEASSIPDNMSNAEARSHIGRPFLNDSVLIKDSTEEYGPIHFISVYGNVTETQAKAFIGYPDIMTVKASFGLYLWDQINHVQVFFLNQCFTPEEIDMKIGFVQTWVNSSNERANIVKRAMARSSILTAINTARHWETEFEAFEKG